MSLVAYLATLTSLLIIIVDFLPLSHVYYAGSHGFDIRAPSSATGEQGQVKQVASSYLPALEAFCKAISARVAHISGSLVENNKYSISIHYRNVASEDDVRTIETAIDELLSQYKDQLKKVFLCRCTLMNEWMDLIVRHCIHRHMAKKYLKFVHYLIGIKVKQ
jgi:trehalose-6-phosphatase